MTVDPPDLPAGPDSGQGSGRERRERIRQLVITEGFVRIDTLAQELGVSPMTIHRDLQKLESRGWLRKVRGGATSRPSTLFHGDVLHRSATMATAKREVTEAVRELLAPGRSVILDESTTALHLVGSLPSYAPLTVITNSLTVVAAVAREPGIDLIALGGTYFPAYDAFLGMQTVNAVGALRADLLFMSTTAVTNDRCFHQSLETVQVKRALMAAAAYTVLLLDHTKFSKVGLHELARLADFDLVVVDSQTDPDAVEQLRRRAVQVRVAPALPAESLPGERAESLAADRTG
ncbi:MAG: DeoR/GlpR family DNA-binding transcription regulator [Natronosporangium sp.]